MSNVFRSGVPVFPSMFTLGPLARAMDLSLCAAGTTSAETGLIVFAPDPDCQKAHAPAQALRLE